MTDSTPSADPWLADIGGPSYALSVDEARMSGTVNGRSFSETTSAEAFHDPGLSTVTDYVEAAGSGDVFVLALYFEGGLDHPAVMPGATFEHTPEPRYDDALYVTAAGRRGAAEEAVLEHDTLARQARIVVGPRTSGERVELLYEGVFEGADGVFDTVRGAIMLERPR